MGASPFPPRCSARISWRARAAFQLRPQGLLHDRAAPLDDSSLGHGNVSGLLAKNPAERLPAFGIANYGALDAGICQSGPTLVSMVGTDRLSNWEGLSPEAEKDRRVRSLDAFLTELDRRFRGLPVPSRTRCS